MDLQYAILVAIALTGSPVREPDAGAGREAEPMLPNICLLHSLARSDEPPK